MEHKKRRIYHVDGDYLEVVYYYDEEVGQYFGEYPDFEETPRYTPNGRPWVNVTIVGCPHADKDYDDCGSCQCMRREQPMDLIGVCMNDIYQRKEKEYKMEA